MCFTDASDPLAVPVMTRHARLSPVLPAVLVALAGCPPPPEFWSCEELNACETSSSGSTNDGEPPTSSSGDTIASDTETESTSSTTDVETSPETLGTTEQPAESPAIVDGVVIPDYIADNGMLSVEASTLHAEGVRMKLKKSGDPVDPLDSIDLTPVGPGAFVGQIAAFTGLANAKYTAVLTPWRGMLVGEAVAVDYVIALPPPGYETAWEVGGLNGRVAAISVLPDGQPVELGTYQEMGESRCYLQRRNKHGGFVDFLDVLEGENCRAIDLKIDRATGRIRILVEREENGVTVWLVGEISSWGNTLDEIGAGAAGDTAFALAARPDVVAVCGSRKVPTVDKLDALAVLLRPGEPDEERVFDFANDPKSMHKFTETVRDCAFSGDTLVLVGEAYGVHGKDGLYRDRLMIIESDLATADDPSWTVPGIELGIQTRALTLDIDQQGRYHIAGDRCLDICEPDGEIWVYEAGGKLAHVTSLGPLGSQWLGPHAIVWSPAGYVVVAFGEMQGNSPVFKVQAFAPGDPNALWTFLPNDKQGLQLALAAAVGLYGEIYAGGLAADEHPSFARIGS